jgi:hypothetical protein
MPLYRYGCMACRAVTLLRIRGSGAEFTCILCDRVHKGAVLLQWRTGSSEVG